MRKLIGIYAILIASCAHGAAVLWNGVRLTKNDLGNGNAEYVLGWSGWGCSIPGMSGTCSLQVRMSIIAFDNADRYCIASYDDDPTATGVTDNWLQARIGDVADASTTRNRTYYFNHCHLDHESGWQNRDIFSDPESDIYLMFAVGSTEDYNNNVADPNCLYGWVNLHVDRNGELGLLRSAIGLDGQSMVVGAIPEPSGGLLLFLGVAALSLRRSRIPLRSKSVWSLPIFRHGK
jgi:hypothetical protein